MRQFAASGYTGTPDFLKIILEKADEMGVDAAVDAQGAGLRRAAVAALRAFYDERGVAVLQCYGTPTWA